MNENEIETQKDGLKMNPKFIFPLIVLIISVLLSFAVSQAYFSNDAVRGNDGIGIFLFMAISPYLLVLLICSVILFISSFKAAKYKRNYFAVFFFLGALLSLILAFAPITLAPFQAVKLMQLKKEETLSTQGINNGIMSTPEGPYKILHVYDQKSGDLNLVYMKLDGKISDEAFKSLRNDPNQDFSHTKLSHDLYVYPVNIDKNKVDDFFTYLNNFSGRSVTIKIDPNFATNQNLRFVDQISNPEMGNTEAFNLPVSSIVADGQDLTLNYLYEKLTPEQTYIGLQTITASPLVMIGYSASDDCKSIRLNFEKNVSIEMDFQKKVICDNAFYAKMLALNNMQFKIIPPSVDQYVENINFLIANGLQFNQNPQRYWLKNPTVILPNGQNITTLFK